METVVRSGDHGDDEGELDEFVEAAVGGVETERRADSNVCFSPAGNVARNALPINVVSVSSLFASSDELSLSANVGDDGMKADDADAGRAFQSRSDGGSHSIHDSSHNGDAERVGSAMAVTEVDVEAEAGGRNSHCNGSNDGARQCGIGGVT